MAFDFGTSSLRISVARRHLDEASRPSHRWKVGINDHVAWGKNFSPWDEDSNPDGLHDFEYLLGPWRRLPEKTGAYRTTDDRDRTFLEHLEATRGTFGLFSVKDVKDELGWHRNTVLNARTSCEARGALEAWPGRPLGEGAGNKPHVFRFAASYEPNGGPSSNGSAGPGAGGVEDESCAPMKNEEARE